MPIVYRHQKGGPLTIEEVDGNFADIDRRLRALETDGVQAEGIALIRQVTDQVEIIGTRGTNFGRFALPKVIPQPKGEWRSGADYVPLDWVNLGPRLYACVRAHHSDTFGGDFRAGHWQVLISAR